MLSGLVCDRRCAALSPGREHVANYSPLLRSRFCWAKLVDTHYPSKRQLNGVCNLALARALPDSTIRVAVRGSDVTESRSTRSLLRTTHARVFPEIVVNNHDFECSVFRTIEIRSTSRPGEIWGRSETGGTCCKRSYALAHAHSLKFELDFKKNKSGLKKMALPAFVRVREDRGKKSPRNVRSSRNVSRRTVDSCLSFGIQYP